MALKIKYQKVGSFEFQQLIEKLKNAQVDNFSACQIHHIIKEVKKGRDKLTAEFKADILDKYATKDESGKILTPSQERPYDIPDDQIEAYTKATEEFGEREMEINWSPLNHQHLQGVKISAAEIEALGELFSEEQAGPGIPMMGQDSRGNVHQLR